jgi:hypothetical protein
MKHTYTIISILLLYIVGCKKDELKDVELMPLKKGNYWIYSTSSFSEGGGQTSSGYDTITIQKIVSVNGKGYAVTDSVNNTALINTDVNTLSITDFNQEFAYLKRVSKNGDRFKNSTSGSYTTESFGYNKYETVLGYKCLRNEDLLKQNGNIMSKTIKYFSPGKGLIKTEVYSLGTNGQLYLRFIDDLVKMSIN